MNILIVYSHYFKKASNNYSSERLEESFEESYGPITKKIMKGLDKMSTTAKIKNELIRLLQVEKNKAGLTVAEVWQELDKTDFKDELYNSKGKRRDGTLVGLTTRIRNNAVADLKIVKNENNNIVYVLSSNSVEYIYHQTEKFLNGLNLKVNEELTKEQSQKFKKYIDTLKELSKQNEQLKVISNELELKKLEDIKVEKQKTDKK